MSKPTDVKNEPLKNEQPIYIVAQSTDSNDEIDVFELLSVIWKKKFFIILWCFILTVLSLFIAYRIPATYVANATFYPPNESDIDILNVPGTYHITKDQVYVNLINHLKTKSVKEIVFRDMYKGDLNKKAQFLGFIGNIKLQLSKINKSSMIATTRTSLSFSDKDPVLSASVVNNLLKQAIDNTKKIFYIQDPKK